MHFSRLRSEKMASEGSKHADNLYRFQVSARPGAIWRILTVRCKRSQYIPIFQIHTRLGLGQGCQEYESQNPETLYETTPKWHSFFLDQTGRFSGQRRRSCETTPKWHGFLMNKLAETVNRLEHRTSNIERW